MGKISDYKAKLLAQVQEASDPVESGAQKMLDLAASDEKMAALIQRLEDPDSSPADKLNAIKTLNIVSIFAKTLPTHSAELTNALRGLISSTNTEVRSQALSYLSLGGDEIAEQHLRSVLEADTPEAEKSVPTHQAIAMPMMRRLLY